MRAFPDWAVQTGGLPNPTLGFPGNYLANPALESRARRSSTRTRRAPAASGYRTGSRPRGRTSPRYFRDQPSVLGYELLNEPFPGTLWEPCLAPTGCPAFDAKLAALYRRVATAIRRPTRAR